MVCKLRLWCIAIGGGMFTALCFDVCMHTWALTKVSEIIAAMGPYSDGYRRMKREERNNFEVKAVFPVVPQYR